MGIKGRPDCVLLVNALGLFDDDDEETISSGLIATLVVEEEEGGVGVVAADKPKSKRSIAGSRLSVRGGISGLWMIGEGSRM